MKFEGFPVRSRFTPVPDLFLNRLAPALSPDELRLMLAVFSVLYQKKGYPRYVTAAELAAHPAASPLKDIGALLQSLTAGGLLLELAASGDTPGTVYFLNNPEGQKAVAQASQGGLKIAGLKAVVPLPAQAPLPDVFTLYEENIGLITPMIAEELKDALATYPEDWIRDALKESVTLNKRSFRYVQRILERWTAEGRDIDGTHRPDTERDKFVRGRYGGLVQR